MKTKKVEFLTLGCKTNQYETNVMSQKFIEAGYEIFNMKESPDIAIINTCTVTNIADRKSRQLFRKVKEKREKYGGANMNVVEFSKDEKVDRTVQYNRISLCYY